MPILNRHRTALAATSLLLLVVLAPADGTFAQQTPQPGQVADIGRASADERSALIEALLDKWGPYVEAEFGVNANVWRERTAARYMGADAANLREAVQRTTFEGAMAVLNGRGHRVSDAEVTRGTAVRPADASLVSSGGLRTVEHEEGILGALTNDLVYTPLAPCRIVDTRSTGAGVIAANSTRNFIAVNASNFTGQGGSATNCGTLGLSATAVAINLTAVTPSGAGYATAYPFGTTQPTTASINYTAGAVVNNALIVQIPNPLSSFDFTIYTFAASHYVADIVGFFAPNIATALQCVETANADLAVAANGGTGNAVAPACAAGYTQTATNCETTSWLMPIVFFQSGTCSARNGDTTSQTLRASRTCCRVPGR